MSGRRSRSRSPRRRRISRSPGTSRRRSEGDGSRYARRRERGPNSSDQRASDRHRGRAPSNDKNSESRKTEPPKNSDNNSPRGEGTAEKDQENHTVKSEVKSGQESQLRVGGVRGHSSLENREKNVLFPSGSNTVNRGRDRARDRSWREERGRGEPRGRPGRHSEGILARENLEETEGRGERRLLEALVDPREVPRNGDYFEHDDRDTPNSGLSRTYVDVQRQERRYQRSPERWSRGRDRSRISHRARDYRGRDYRDRRSDDRQVRDWTRDPPQDRERRRGDMRSDWGDRQRSGRDRSPVHWKHDMFESVNQSPEPEEPVQQEPASTWKSNEIVEGIEDFNIDDLLLMDNPVVKMELDV